MLERLNRTAPAILMVWMLGAQITGIGLGLYLADYLKQYALGILAFGLILHIWAMYRIYSEG